MLYYVFTIASHIEFGSASAVSTDDISLRIVS